MPSACGSGDRQEKEYPGRAVARLSESGSAAAPDSESRATISCRSPEHEVSSSIHGQRPGGGAVRKRRRTAGVLAMAHAAPVGPMGRRCGSCSASARRRQHPEHRRRQLIEADAQSAAARPHAGRRGDRQFVGDADAGLVQPQARRMKLVGLSDRGQLEADAVVGQQPQPAATRVLDGHGPLRPAEHLQQQD